MAAVTFDEFMRHADDAVYMDNVDLLSGYAKEVFDENEKLRRERDEARAEILRLKEIIGRMKAEEDQGVRDYLDLRDAADRALSERDRARDACNAYWHDLTRIALLCAQTDDEYPLKAVERMVQNYSDLKRDHSDLEREYATLLCHHERLRAESDTAKSESGSEVPAE